MLELRESELENAIQLVYEALFTEETRVVVPLDEHLPPGFVGTWTPKAPDPQDASRNIEFVRGVVREAESPGQFPWVGWFADACVSVETLESMSRVQNKTTWFVSPDEAEGLPGLGLSFWKMGAVFLVPRERIVGEQRDSWFPHPHATFYSSRLRTDL